MFTARIKLPTFAQCGASAARQGLRQWYAHQLPEDQRSWHHYVLGVQVTTMLRKAREAAKLSRRELASRSGISYNTIWRLESFINEAAKADLRIISDWCFCCGFRPSIKFEDMKP